MKSVNERNRCYSFAQSHLVSQNTAKFTSVLIQQPVKSTFLMLQKKLVHQLKDDKLLPINVQTYDSIGRFQLSGHSLSLLEKSIILNLIYSNFFCRRRLLKFFLESIKFLLQLLHLSLYRLIALIRKLFFENGEVIFNNIYFVLDFICLSIVLVS